MFSAIACRLLWLLFGILFLQSGCALRVRPDPLEGWTNVGAITWNGLKTPGERMPPPWPQAITADYRDYIDKLPIVKGKFADRSESYFITRVSFYEGEAGQRAVEIRIPLHGVEWKHVLIYDKDAGRTKAIKYASEEYVS